MKKLLLALLVMPALANAQTIIKDSVVMGANYANQVFYSMKTGVVSTSPTNNWHIGITSNNSDAAIIANQAGPNASTVFLYPRPLGLSAFDTIDTTGMTAHWPQLYNDENFWSEGAFNRPGNLANFDYGWGTYDYMNTHNILGTRMYVIKVPTGSGGYAYRKIAFEVKAGLGSGKLNAGDIVLHIATIDNTTINRRDTFRDATFSNQLFGYYNVLTNQFIQREPNYLDWDLTMTSYIAQVPYGPPGQTIPYPVEGFQQNFYMYFIPGPGGPPQNLVTVVKAYPIDTAKIQASAYQPSAYSDSIGTIGWDWKVYNQGNNSYSLQDSLVYFVKTQNGAIYKMRMTYYGADKNGVTRFDKTEVVTSTDNITKGTTRFIVAGNPVSSGTMQLLADNSEAISDATIVLTDMAGNTVKTMYVGNVNATMHIWNMPVGDIANGMYLVQLKGNNTQVTTRAIIVH